MEFQFFLIQYLIDDLHDFRTQSNPKRNFQNYLFEISKSIFDRLINQISKLIKLYNSDILIMSGRSFKLNSIQELFETYQPVMPNRMINMIAGKKRGGA